MAINPSTNANMTGRVTAPSAAYPFGSAKDETSPGANDGSPYFLARANDIFGLQQAILDEAGIVPSGNADTALLSQYLQGLKTIISQVGKNKIINGNFDIWQREVSFTGAASLDYTADRWQLAGTTAINASQQTFAIGQTDVPNEPEFFISAGSGGASVAFLRTKIEDARTFAGQEATLSFYLKSATETSVNVGVKQNFGSGGSADVDIPLVATSVTSTFKRYEFTVDVASISGKTVGADSFLEVNFELPVTPNGIEVAQVQFELGNTATQFETLSLAQVLALCQRYYRKSYQLAAFPGSVSTNSGHPYNVVDVTGLFLAGDRFGVPMRVAPDVTIFQPSTGTAATVEDLTEGNSRAVASIEVGENGLALIGLGSGATAGALYQFEYEADAEL